MRTINKKRFTIKEFLFKLVMLLPAFIILGVFMFFPIYETFRLSFTRTSGLVPGPYIGFANYIRLFTNEDFQAGLIHIFQWAFWSIVIQIPLEFFIAYSCTNYKNRLTNTLKSIYYLGTIIPVSIIAMLSLFIIMPNAGVIITIAKSLKWEWLAAIDFVGDSRIAFWTIFTVATWAYMGFGIVYFIANIEQIPGEFIEAAMIDGATRRQIIRYIIIPQVSPALRIQALLCAIGSIKLFDLPWLIAVGGPGNASTTLSIELYKQGFVNMQYGKGAAIGVVIFLIALGFTIIQFSLQREQQ